MKRLITTRDFDRSETETFSEDARELLDEKPRILFEGKSITTILFENSTGTLPSFESVARRLRARVLRLDVSRSSSNRGETLYDTAANLDAMGPHAIIARHQHSGVPYLLVEHLHCPVLNTGGEEHAHPSQALLDLFTIKEHFKDDTVGRRALTVGDVKNSRVTTSNMELLEHFGLSIALVIPPHFMLKASPRSSYELGERSVKKTDITMNLRI